MVIVNGVDIVDSETFVQWYDMKVWHMDFSFWLIIALFVTFVWRHIIYSLEKGNGKGEGGRIIPTWAQYYSVLYAFGFVLMVLNFGYCGMMFHSTNYLDGASIKAAQVAKLNISDSALSTILDDFEQQANLDDFPVLKYFSMSMPLWVFLTFMCCAMHTRNIVREMPAKLRDDYKRDRTIVILALPFIYGFMSLWSVMHCWQITASSIGLAGNFFHTVGDAIEILLKAYEANFAVADAYEALALWSFATLTLDVLAQGGQKLQGRLNQDRKKLNMLSGDDSAGELEAKRQLDQDLTKFVEDSDMLSESITRLTMGGIKWFCVSCIASAICEILPVQEYDLWGEGAEMHFVHKYLTPTNAAYMNGFLTGLGTIGSFAAIENLIIVELEFGESHLGNFGTTRKFWSTKILVSLVFLQQILFALPPMSNWSLMRQKLTNANMLCFECFLISIAHFFSWKPTEKWYDGPSGLSDCLLDNDSHDDGHVTP